jgi:histidine triad (HIT) family protein
LRFEVTHCMSDCLFCRIVNKDIPADLIYEDEQVVAFRDLHPQAPVHVLIIPRRHVMNLNAAVAEDEALLGHLCTVAAELARRDKIAESGYRLVANVGPDAGESIGHLHFHLLGGRHFGWPPG